MSDFKSEILPSGAELQISNEINCISTAEHYVQVTKADIARMYGIAFPEKRRTGECYNLPEQTDVPDIDVGDIQPGQECNDTNKKLDEALQLLAEKEALLKTAFDIMIRNMALNPDQHAFSDMYHLVNNELDRFANAQPLISEEVNEVLDKCIEVAKQDRIIGECDHRQSSYSYATGRRKCNDCGEEL